MTDILHLLRNPAALDQAPVRDRLAALAPTLSFGATADLEATPGGSTEPARDAGERRWLAREGYAVVERAADARTCANIETAIEQLLAAGLPAVFVYLFDEPWLLGERLRARASSIVGRPYSLVEDVWAFHVAPGRGRGWPPHRGLRAPLLDRDAPEFLNTWLALTDASAERSCMHAIPLDEDPHYPNDLEGEAHLDAPLAAVRALPIPAGDALAWNANLLHWGGPCSARSAGPRASITFSLCRDDALDRLGVAPLQTANLDLPARLDTIARQVVTYGRGQPDVTEALFSWAQAASMLREAATVFAGRKQP